MKPRMKFYSDGNRVVIGNMIIPYELLTYIIQLNRKEVKLNTDVMIPYTMNPKTGFMNYIKAL